MILRDPVHGLISFESPEEQIVVRLIATAEVQRLRRIRQLGVASLAFPGAEHTRFAHVVGTAHVMKRLLARLREVELDITPAHRISPEHAVQALAAALLHDVGHGPFSHLFEDALPSQMNHEDWGQVLLLDDATEVHRTLVTYDPSLPHRVAALIHGQHALPYLARAVSGTLDVDRCDYLLRDAHSTGVPYGRFDLDWLLRSLRFAAPDGAPPTLAIDGTKGVVSLESFVLARLFMFQQVYFHKSVRAAEWMIRAILLRAVDLLREGIHLEQVPTALELAANGNRLSPACYLELDDGVLWGAMHAWEHGPDPVLADLSRRIRNRALFKTYELHAASGLDEQRALQVARDIATQQGLDPHAYVGLDIATDVPFAGDNDPLLVVSSREMPRKPSEVSFLLGRLHGETVRRARVIMAPELRDPIMAALLPPGSRSTSGLLGCPRH